MQLGAMLQEILHNRYFPSGGCALTYSPAFVWWPIKGDLSSWRPVRVLSLTEACATPAKFLKVRKTLFVFW